jgi:acetyl esterase/lipase
MTHLAAALTQEGYATWTIEYRRLGDPNGGWPNTFLDVAQSVDVLRILAARYSLDLHHLIAIGHSSGGQLAYWLASRHHLPEASPLYIKTALGLSGVIGLAAITDLEQYRIGPEQSCHGAVAPLMGGTPAQVPVRYAEASPIALLPLGIPQVLIHGAFDDVVEPESAVSYATAARKSSDKITLKRLPLGHFDLVLAKGSAYDAIRNALKTMTLATN